MGSILPDAGRVNAEPGAGVSLLAGLRCQVTRRVAEDIRAHICADTWMVDIVIDIVIDDVIVHCNEAPDRPIADVWREYANRIERDDPELGSLRPEMCGDPADLKDGRVDIEMYLERCWAAHCAALQVNEMPNAA